VKSSKRIFVNNSVKICRRESRQKLKCNLINSVNIPKYDYGRSRTDSTMKTALRETQTLRAGCSKAEPKISPCRRPPSRGCRTAKM